jgi:hypothetical protein
MATAKEIADGLPAEVVLFLGAGASKAVGMPVMNEFFESFLHDNNFASNINNAPEYVFHGVTSAHQRQNRTALVHFLVRTAYLGEANPVVYDLERVLGFANQVEALFARERYETLKRLLFLAERCTALVSNDIETFRGAFQTRGGELDSFIQNLKNSISGIRRGIYDVFGTGSDKKTSVKAAQVYIQLLELLSKYYSISIPVFTTNYDSVLEGMTYYHRPMHWQLVDGFSDIRGAPQWALSNYAKHPDGGRGLFYFKLHGSLSWKRDEDANIVKRALTESFPTRPVILYPVESSKRPHQEPFLTLYGVFSEVIHKAKRCLVIGFSFRDDRLREIFRRELEMRKDFRLTILCPTPAKGTEYIDEHISKMVADFEDDRVRRIDARFGDPDALDKVATALFG